MLTDVALKALKPREKAYKQSDSGGLFLVIHPTGRKSWQLAYRVESKQKFASGGSYPDVSLKQARDWRDTIKAQLTLGMQPTAKPDPDGYRISAPVVVAPSETFEQVAREWYAKRLPGWTPRYAGVIMRRLEADIFPYVGREAIAAITPRQMLEAFRAIETRGAVEMAHRVKNHCSEVFRYAIPDGRCVSDPCRDLAPGMGRPKPVQHLSKVAAKDLPAFFAKLNLDQGDRMSHLALRWTMLTMVRTQETRFAEWSEFEDLDGEEPIWRIPSDRMKMRSEHLVPLPPQAVELLKEIRRRNVYLAAGNMQLGKYLFPVANSKTQTISENRMLDIMYRIGLRGKATVHGFRGLASTVLNESGLFEPDWIEHQLAHVSRGVRAAYNSARYLSHRRKMMIWWANYLEYAENVDRDF
ncbi:tyrosine-type recombinase/integrase [Novosphingobium sp. RL4]|uniref:tyrosine-type recombinase/integrase n=1 Tax=Novosphingobium sp. RL4 TaxID=3109595 RepID=UPI002D7A3339|nr:integrase arm-type DNA-binding domain-containing protein [Novosphingobium sp. RL4]WRT94502.1 integrase arm-type DNA-binding domain-containing protein [Novosphingobium sp. RL4]